MFWWESLEAREAIELDRAEGCVGLQSCPTLTDLTQPAATGL